MIATKRCDLCETPLEFEQDGRRIAFTAHTDEWCRATARELIVGLRLALKAKDEAHRGFALFLLRQADDALCEAGARTLTERAARAYDEATRRLLGLPTDGGLPS